MKRVNCILTALFALAVILAGAFPAYAADQGNYYPVSVEEYTCGENNEPRISKVYQLSLSDDPSLIPTGDFERGGRLYSLLDMTRKDEVGVDIRPHTQTVTAASDTNDMETILQRLDAEIDTVTDSGTLRLDHTSVQVTTDGYATKNKTISASRTYPNLSDADLSLVPKTITDDGRTLTLADVQWSDDTVGYTAAASYTGTSSSRYATGYTVTATYSGEVSKTGCDMVTYTAVFGSRPDPNSPVEPEALDNADAVPDAPASTPCVRDEREYRWCVTCVERCL